MGHLKTLISFLFVFSSASASVLDEKASYASRRVFWSQAQGPCTVTANLLYSNGYFVREISPAEQQELLEYETNMEEYNKVLSRVYIGPTFVRQLSDEERQELDEFEYKMREYQQGMVSGVRKLSTSWQPGGDYAIPFYHKIYDTENGTSTSPEEVTCNL